MGNELDGSDLHPEHWRTSFVSKPTRAWLNLTPCLVLFACGGNLLAPAEPEEVTVTLSVTGGFAGAGYGVVVDGAARQALVSCGLVCAVPETQTVLPISAALVGELASALDESGILSMDGADFGTECCDQFHVDLTYERGSRSAHVRGTESRLPPTLHPPIRLLTALAQGRVPMIVSPDTRPEDWPRDSYSLGKVEAGTSTIAAEVTYSGGCGEHRMDLVAWGGWMESSPVQINALVTHDDSDDPCDAVVDEVRSFDLFPLAEAYAEAYGEIGPERPTVILRLWDPASGSPRLVEVVL